MIDEQQHIIQRVTLDLNCPAPRDVREIQNEYLSVFQKDVLPGLEAVLSQLSREDEVVSIKSLNIDLGRLTTKVNRRSLAEMILREIKKELEAKFKNSRTNAEIKSVSLAQSKLALFIHFLKKGYLPPFAQSLDLLKEIQILLKNEPALLIAEIKKAYRETGDVFIKRMSLQVPETLLEQIILEGSKGHRLVLKLKQSLFQKRIFQRKTYRLVILQSLLTVVFSGKKYEKGNERELTLHFRKEFRRHLKIAKGILPVVNDSSSIKIKKPGKAMERNETDETLKGMYVQNASIILLHPFLKSFFEESQLLDDKGKFKDEDAAERAVSLLHFLATGKSSAPEYELAFQKLICGLALDHPIQHDFVISEAEKKESNKMMEAVINYWDALGNASVEGLREGFLQRDGKIQENENNLILQVERKTIDILLDRLPWNISLIKLPWMKKLIRVEWA